MHRSSYGQRDYAFGQLMLTLRTNIGLTQEGLGKLLGVSRRAVAEWEAGSSYPKAERLQQLITIGVRASAFAAGHEEEEIRALWKAARTKLLLDDAWLRELLAPAAPVPPPQAAPAEPPGAPALETPAVVQPVPAAELTVAPAGQAAASFTRVDWTGALDVSQFTGREVEVAELSQWIVQEHCRVVSVLGMGGVGKSTLASSLGLRLAPQFEALLWCSVRDAPTECKRPPRWWKPQDARHCR
jgi:transcriptional regulator with XRE-family HTH domain